jgi:hypothetical protein
MWGALGVYPGIRLSGASDNQVRARREAGGVETMLMNERVSVWTSVRKK